MENEINALKEQLAATGQEPKADAEQFRLKFLSKKGSVSVLIDAFRALPPDEKKKWGKDLNQLKAAAEAIYEDLKEGEAASVDTDASNVLFDLPVYLHEPGGKHPINLVRDEMLQIFSKLGFEPAEGPELEDDWHNFGALNFAENHPARDMQDTFFAGERVLRTHTSSVQIREMESKKPPLRLVMPGRVYRNEAVSARSNCFFHQLEGLYIDENVSFADLKQTLFYFVSAFFGERTKIRFRPSYFPFTEPSAEMDIWAGTETEEDRRLTKGTGWLEILGCGMVHPNVLKNCGIDPEKYSGYAFGMGLDRIAMLRYGVKDIRDFFHNDIRFLQQFAAY
jgi:phenylalanyl-tRNA synthetase alpha chain